VAWAIALHAFRPSAPAFESRDRSLDPEKMAGGTYHLSRLTTSAAADCRRATGEQGNSLFQDTQLGEEFGSSSGSFSAIRPRCQVPIRFVFLIESQYIRQVTHFLPPDARQVRSFVLGVSLTIEQADFWGRFKLG
jgi:hypothetical protein